MPALFVIDWRPPVRAACCLPPRTANAVEATECSGHWVPRLTGGKPFCRAVLGRIGSLSAHPIRNIDVCRMVKRRLRDAGLSGQFSPHSFRVATATDLLLNEIPLEDVQYLLGHADPRTTRLYDRRQKQVTRNTMERMSM